MSPFVGSRRNELDASKTLRHTVWSPLDKLYTLPLRMPASNVTAPAASCVIQPGSQEQSRSDARRLYTDAPANQVLSSE